MPAARLTSRALRRCLPSAAFAHNGAAARGEDTAWCREPRASRPTGREERKIRDFPSNRNRGAAGWIGCRMQAYFCHRLLIGAVLCLTASLSFAYEPEIHQKLTFIAAKQLNRCLGETELPAFNALQVRIIAKANTRQADANLFTRMFRWNYYDRGKSGDRHFLWVIDTRFDGHFNEVVERLERAATVHDRYRQLGRIVGYVQDVTSPPHAVPVYATRWWRLSLQDRFDRHPVDEEGVTHLVSSGCDSVLQEPRDYHGYRGVLENAARDTLAAVQRMIEGLPVTWEVFWQPHENPARFGAYGPAGNRFGRGTRFPCGEAEQCVLLDDDPLYEDFAMHRHAAAVTASMRAMLLALGYGQN